METLAKLFGNESKVKIMRLFLFNEDTVFDAGEISERVKADISKVRKEVNLLEKIGLIKRRSHKSSRKTGFVLNKQFDYLVPLQNFLINVEPFSDREIINRVSRVGSIKLIVVAGVFIQEPESRIDILIVGDHIKNSTLDNMIKNLEAEIGKELRYVYFTTEDFKYRLSMCDKLMRDILDYPHRKVLNKLGIIE